jgi:hypothetical protein
MRRLRLPLSSALGGSNAQQRNMAVLLESNIVARAHCWSCFVYLLSEYSARFHVSRIGGMASNIKIH